MASYGRISKRRLKTCTKDIQTIFNKVIEYMDVSIVEGNRAAEKQHEYWKKGRQLISTALDPKEPNNWHIIDKSKVVTYKDGYVKLSKHQKSPSPAIDAVPFPSMWSDKGKSHELVGVIKVVQADLLAEGKIKKLLHNGADLWDGFDLPHFQE